MSNAYFKDVNRHKLLTREKEVELAQAIEKGDEIARFNMINSNLRLAISIAKHYQNRGCDLEDLIQEANIGLVKAVERFDWKRGFKFSTYASWWIRQSVSRHVMTHAKTIRLPAHATNLLFRINNLKREYTEEFGTSPTTKEIAEILDVSESLVDSTMTAGKMTLSLQAKISEAEPGSKSLQDTIPDEDQVDPADVLDSAKFIEAIKIALADLTPREEKIIRLRFGLSDSVESVNTEMSADEIAVLDERLATESEVNDVDAEG